MKRPDDAKNEAARWGIPGGKVEKAKGETSEQAIKREILEETGLDINHDFPGSTFKSLKTVYVTLSGGFCFAYHTFEWKIPYKPEKIILNPAEHVDYSWMTLPDAIRFEPLIAGEDECFLEKLQDDLAP